MKYKRWVWHRVLLSSPVAPLARLSASLPPRRIELHDEILKYSWFFFCYFFIIQFIYLNNFAFVICVINLYFKLQLLLWLLLHTWNYCYLLFIKEIWGNATPCHTYNFVAILFILLSAIHFIFIFIGITSFLLLFFYSILFDFLLLSLISNLFSIFFTPFSIVKPNLCEYLCVCMCLCVRVFIYGEYLKSSS